MLTPADIRAAAEQIAPYVLHTPLLPHPLLSELLGVRVSLKYELLQHTASFKTRGAFNAILSLSDAQRAQGLLAVSGGNHGKAVAYAARQRGLHATVLMPASAAPSAVDYVRAAGAAVELLPSAAAAFERAQQLQAEGLSFIHPYADPLVVAGQATLGLEIVAAAPDVSDVVASIGGGGMIGGVALVVHAANPQARIWGVEPEGANVMQQALAAGRVLPPQTATSRIATLAPPAVSELTLQLAQQHLTDLLTFPDAATLPEMAWLLDHAHVLVEPAAAICLCAARQLRGRFSPGGHVVIILCGAGITLEEYDKLREAQ